MTTPELEAMARAQFEAEMAVWRERNGITGTDWDTLVSVEPGFVAQKCEAMRAALKAIREPSEGMVEAIWRDVQTVSDESRMLHLLADAEASHKAKAKRRWKAAVDHILGSDGE